MTESPEPGGSDAAPAVVVPPDPAPVPEPSIVAARALAAPVTVDRTARSVEVVWSTGARARNFIPALGLVTEELDMAPGAVRMAALRSGHSATATTPQATQCMPECPAPWSRSLTVLPRSAKRVAWREN